MLTQKLIHEKLFALPNEFRKNYEAGRFAQAYDNYSNALRIANFVELDESEMVKLFGGRPYGREEVGLFDEKTVQTLAKNLFVKRK